MPCKHCYYLYIIDEKPRAQRESNKTVQGLAVSNGRNKCSVPGSLAPKPTTTFLTYNNHCKPIKTFSKFFWNDLAMGLYMVGFGCFFCLFVCF